MSRTGVPIRFSEEDAELFEAYGKKHDRTFSNAVLHLARLGLERETMVSQILDRLNTMDIEEILHALQARCLEQDPAPKEGARKTERQAVGS